MEGSDQIGDSQMWQMLCVFTGCVDVNVEFLIGNL
jgi:hypothetical protein